MENGSKLKKQVIKKKRKKIFTIFLMEKRLFIQFMKKKKRNLMIIN